MESGEFQVSAIYTFTWVFTLSHPMQTLYHNSLEPKYLSFAQTGGVEHRKEKLIFPFPGQSVSLELHAGSNAQRLPGCCSSPQRGMMDPMNPNVPVASQHEPTFPVYHWPAVKITFPTGLQRSRYYCHCSWLLHKQSFTSYPTVLRGAQPCLHLYFEWKLLNARNSNTQHSKTFLHAGSSTPIQQYVQRVKQEVFVEQIQSLLNSPPSSSFQDLIK